MPDYQRVVTEVRGVLRSGNQTLTDQLRELSGQFAQVCASAANRLQRCEEYVFQGRRSEAVQLAEAQPVLMDVLAAINFPERPQWDELTAMYSLPAAPAVDAGRAAAVNKAFAELQPLQTHLREHRRLALQQAPVLERLGILRRLFGSDPNNPVWPQQIKAFEAIRIRELQPEFDDAVRRNDVEETVGIWRELTQIPWVDPPVDLIESARGVIGQFLRQKARSNLRALSVELQNAMKARDVVAARALHDRWDQECLQADLGPGDKLAKDANRPLAWLKDMESLLSKLRDRNLDDEDIHYQYWVMDRWQKYLPNDLENAYQERVKQMAQSSVMRERLIVVGAIIGCLVVFIALILFFIFFVHR